jgi:alpha-tubulin suppressor-like RCC1 family protein
MKHVLASPRSLLRLAVAIAVLGAVAVLGVGQASAATPTGLGYAWGANGFGELGNNTTTNSPTPVRTKLLPNGVVQVVAAARHSFALLADGSVVAWGRNASGELGNGTAVQSLVPVAVSGFGAGSGVVAVAGNAPEFTTTSISGDGHSMAVKSDGSVWGWGHGNAGELGDGVALPIPSGTQHDALAPLQVVNLGPNSVDPAIAIAAGAAHSLALKKDGSVWAWGHDLNGQLGDGAVLPGTDRSTPVQVIAPSSTNPVTSIAAGDSFSMALKKDGSVWTWGHNASGELGDNTINDRSTPAVVSGLSSGVSKITAGGSFCVVIKTDGSVMAWGNNQTGELGNNGAPNDSLVPVQVTGLGPNSGIASISAGFSHVIALKTSGSLLVWGHNASGQLGDGTLTQQNAPEALTTGPWSQVSAGGSHSLASLTPTMALSRKRGPAGLSETVTGAGFRPAETVNVIYKTGLASPSQQPVCSGIVSNFGTFSCTGTIPSTNMGALGLHGIVAIGATSGLRAGALFALTPSLSISPNAGPVGTGVMITGSNFAPNESVQVNWRTLLPSPSPSVLPLCTATASSTGTIACSASVPTTDAGPTGNHPVVATGSVSLVFVSTPFTLQ